MEEIVQQDYYTNSQVQEVQEQRERSLKGANPKLHSKKTYSSEIYKNNGFSGVVRKPEWWIVLTIALGIIFRFANLDLKIYWSDEAFTSLRVSGYSWLQFIQHIGSGELVSIADLQRYQTVGAGSSVLDTIRGLALEESQVAPLYFILVRFWSEWLGSSVAVIRSFSAIISLFAFPCLYWLCGELFSSATVSRIAIALLAISPVQVLYAQEARAYSLLIVVTLFSSAALLRAIRVKSSMSWRIYGISIAIGLYTQLFFAFVALSHAVYIVLLERPHLRKPLSKTLVSYGRAACAGGCLFLPWALIMIDNPPKGVSWTETPQTAMQSAIRWAGIVSRAFVDFGIDPTAPGYLKAIALPFILAVLGLIFLALYVVWKRTPRRSSLMVMALSASVILPLLLLDFGLGRRYGTTRYILPSLLGLQIAVAYLLANQVERVRYGLMASRSFAAGLAPANPTLIALETASSAKVGFTPRLLWQQRLWQGVLISVVLMGVISCGLSARSQIWWNKLPEIFGDYPAIAQIVNQTERPLLISYTGAIRTQSLSYLLKANTMLQIDEFGVNRSNRLEVPPGNFSDIFVLQPSKKLLTHLDTLEKPKLKQVYHSLWKLE